jgi:hypothetical protein
VGKSAMFNHLISIKMHEDLIESYMDLGYSREEAERLIMENDFEIFDQCSN